jgi:hypothetical protein
LNSDAGGWTKQAVAHVFQAAVLDVHDHHTVAVVVVSDLQDGQKPVVCMKI